MGRYFAALVLIAGASLMGTGGWMMSRPIPYPTAISLSPSSTSVTDTSPAGTVVSTATVTMSDGSAYSGQLSVSDPQFAASGLNVVTAVSPLSPDGTRSITVTAN